MRTDARAPHLAPRGHPTPKTGGARTSRPACEFFRPQDLAAIFKIGLEAHRRYTVPPPRRPAASPLPGTSAPPRSDLHRKILHTPENRVHTAFRGRVAYNVAHDFAAGSLLSACLRAITSSAADPVACTPSPSLGSARDRGPLYRNTGGLMPAKTEKQAKFMRACAHGFKPKTGKCPPKAVAREFMHTAKKPRGR